MNQFSITKGLDFQQHLEFAADTDSVYDGDWFLGFLLAKKEQSVQSFLCFSKI